MTAVSEVVIAGAGIAGLSAGIALARSGIRASIYDAAPKSALEGSGLTVSAIGMRAIRDLGLGHQVAALGAGASETIIADAAGHQFDTIATPPLAGADLCFSIRPRPRVSPSISETASLASNSLLERYVSNWPMGSVSKHRCWSAPMGFTHASVSWHFRMHPNPFPRASACGGC